MAVTNPLRPSVAAGEIGEMLWDRHDLTWHASAAKRLTNFIATPWGPARHCGGMRYVDSIDSTYRWRLVPFRFSADQAYILAFGELNVRVYANKGNVLTGGGAPVVIGSPYHAADLPHLRYAQSGDVLYLVHHSYPVHQAMRLAHNVWQILPINLIDGPYYEINVDPAKTLVCSVSVGVGTLTAAGHAPFTPDDVGRIVRMKLPAPVTEWGYVLIQGYVSPTVVNVAVQKDLGGVGVATAEWRMGLYSEGTGYPAAVTLHQGRLVFGSQPLGSLPRLDGSVSGDLTNFTPGVEDDDAYAAVIVTGDVNIIHDLVSLRDLLILTAGRELAATAGTGAVLTPTNIGIAPVTAHGTRDVQSLVAYSAVIFVQRDGRVLRQMNYQLEADGYQARNLMIRAPHMGHGGPADQEGGLLEICFAQEPHSIIWGVRDDGMLVGMGFLPEQEVMGWFRRRPAPSAAYKASCESVASIPYGGVDQVWATVWRVVNGAIVKTVEIIEEALARDVPVEDAFYVDSGLSLYNTGEAESGSMSCTLSLSAHTGPGVTLTAGAPIFAPGDVGRAVKYLYVDTINRPPAGRDENGFLVWETAYAEITGYTSPTQVTADITVQFDTLGPIAATDWGMTVTQIGGLGHLEGETVKVVGDGAVQADKVVVGGMITLDTPAMIIHAGLFAPAIFEPVLPETGAAQGTRIARPQRIVQTRIKVAYSFGGKVYQRGGSVNGTKKELIRYRAPADELNHRTPLYTGVKEVPISGNYTRDPGLVIEQDIPMPMLVTSLEPVLDVGDTA